MDIELSRPLTTIEGMEGYGLLQALVRLHGTPIGYVKIPVTHNVCTPDVIGKAIVKNLCHAIIRHLLCDGLMTLPRPGGLQINDLLSIPHPVSSSPLPLITVAVCTRARASDLARCLDSLNRLDYPALDMLVVDNAPASDATERLVRTTFANVRYVREPRPGLDWARNRAIVEAWGEIIAYTDDDVVVDSDWLKALANVFVENPEVMVVTGLVVPYELETEAQILFEQSGGFGRGFERKWRRVDCERGERAATRHGSTGKYGTGANMAYRRSLFNLIGGFDPALDVGTVTSGGGDLEMFFRVLKRGYTLVYEPGAMVRHCHRRDYAQLRAQLATWGTSFSAYLVQGVMNYPDERAAFIRLGFRELWLLVRSLLVSYACPSRFPRDIILARLRAFFGGLRSYQKAQRTAAKIEQDYGAIPRIATPRKIRSQNPRLRRTNTTAKRAVDLSQPLCALADVADYSIVRVFVTRDGQPLGSVDIANHHQSIGVTRLCESIADRFGLKLLEQPHSTSMDSLQANILAAMTKDCMTNDDRALGVLEGIDSCLK